MKYKGNSSFEPNNNIMIDDCLKYQNSGNTRFYFEDLLSSLQDSMSLNSADHFITNLKKIREFIINHPPVLYDIMIEKRLFNSLIALGNLDQNINVRNNALSCFSTIIAMIPRNFEGDVVSKIIESGYFKLINLCFINDNLCNDDTFIQIYKGVGNFIPRDPITFLQNIEFNSFYQKALMILLKREEPICEIMFCFSQIVHFIKNLDFEQCLKISELFKIQIQKGISNEKIKSEPHQYALNGLFLILEKKSLQKQEKIQIIQKNNITTLLSRYFEVSGIVEEQVICCQIIQWFYILCIPLDIPYINCIFWCITNFSKYQKTLLEELYCISLSDAPISIFYNIDFINTLKKLIFNSNFKKKVISFNLYTRLILLAPNDIVFEIFFNIDTINIYFLMIENDYTIYDGDVHNSFIRLIKLSKENGRIKK